MTKVPFHDYVLRPDYGDTDAEAVTRPDVGEALADAVLVPNPAMPAPAMPSLAVRALATDDEIEPPIVRHDPFAATRAAPWMNRRLGPSGRAAAFLRRELEDFPAIEGRDPARADLDAIVRRTVDTMVPIFKRERDTDIAYDELEKREARIARRPAPADNDLPEGLVKVSGETAPPPTQEAAVVESDGRAEIGPLLAQLGPEARNERVRAEKWSSPSADGEYLKALEQFEGHEFRLPDGSRVPDRHSPTRYLMSPVEDLRRVAEAGRAAGKAGLAGIVAAATPGASGPSAAALHQAYEQTRTAIGQGGEFDYQRKAAAGGKDGFIQLRRFRNVSNFNVGLFMQQAGAPLDFALGIAGLYAWKNSSNFRPDRPPYFLDPQTEEFIRQGHAAGQSGAFD